jgi:hypothetical protein
MILNYLLKVSFFLRRKSEDRHFDFFTMRWSVGLRQPRLDCTVVMIHELNNKGFRYCEKIIFTGYYEVETMMILNYSVLVKSFFFLRRKSEDRHFDFFTMKWSVGLRQPRLDCTVVMSHEPNSKGFRFASLASVHCHSTANIIIIKGS